MSSETKKQIKDRVYAILETLFIAAFLWSAFRLGMIIHNYTKGDSIYDDSRDRFTVTSAAGDSKSSGSGSTDLAVDLAALRKINPEVIGWIYIKDTDTSYPLLKGPDNSKYLKHTYNLTYSDFGSIFVDSAASSDFSDRNTLIYGHNTKNGSMFGSLKKYKNKSYMNAHNKIYIITSSYIYEYTVFAAYTVTTSDDVYYTDFDSDSAFADWINERFTLSEASADTFKASGKEKIITLSTCTSRTPTERFTVNAKLTGKEKNTGTYTINK